MFEGVGLFGSSNPIRKRNVELDNMPTETCMKFMHEVCKFTRKGDITTEVEKRMDDISDGIDNVLEFNNNIDTKDDDDYRLIQIPEVTMDLVVKATEHMGQLVSGGKSKYRKDKLWELFHMGMETGGNNVAIFPKGYDVESEFALYYPEDTKKKLSAKGNWIMILDDYAIDSAPKKYDIHYATRFNRTSPSYGGGYKHWYASIIVNNKEVLMQPREYVIIPDTNVLLDNIGKGIEMIEGSSSARLDKNKVFYLKSRGFNQAEIYQILFKSITNKGFCHFRVDPEVGDYFDLVQRGVVDLEPTAFQKMADEHLENLPNIKFKKPC